MSENTCAWCGIVVFLLMLICALMVAQDRDELKAEAVKRGYAEWIVIGENKTEFKWKENN